MDNSYIYFFGKKRLKPILVKGSTILNFNIIFINKLQVININYTKIKNNEN